MIIDMLREQLQYSIEMNQFYMGMITDMRKEIEELRGVSSRKRHQPEMPVCSSCRVIRVEFGRVGEKESF